MVDQEAIAGEQRILIVEDSSTQALHLQAVLEDEGFTVVWAENGAVALEAMGKQEFDFVVTDIEMPEISGYELCAKIKEKEQWRNLPVILLTSRKDPKNIILGLECGADSFFTKPYDAEILVRRIRQLLYNRSLRSQGRMKVGVEISLFGKVITINNEREQILDLLISTFEDIIQTNSELEESQRKLTEANNKIEEYVDILENRVRTSEERYRTVFDHLAEGVLICNKHGVVDSVNPAYQSIFGCNESDLGDKRVSDFLPCVSDDLEAWMNGEDYHYLPEVKCHQMGGGGIFVSCSISRIGSNGGSEFVCLVHDRTEAKKMEDRLRQSEKMEAIGQLTGGIAHDYNNQLTVIEGAADELGDLLAEDKEGRSLVEMIGTVVQAGKKLTRRLLTFARSQPVEREVIEMATMLDELSTLAAPLLGKQIELNISIVDDADWRVKLDRSELENALLNLCINAKHAMNDNGRIEIEVMNLRVDDEDATEIGEITPGDYVLVNFSDTGSGIPEEIRAKIFDPFFTTKSSAMGTGMGLAMVYGFIKQSGGQIKVYSEMGVGTTFHIYLPRSMETVLSDSTATVKVRSNIASSLHVFLVDDDALICRLALKQFKALGHVVETAHTAADALQEIEAGKKFDLLITDIMLGSGMSGTELADAVKQVRPELKVLFTSGFTEQALLDQSLLQPDVNLLVKPYNRQEIQAAIEKVMSM